VQLKQIDRVSGISSDEFMKNYMNKSVPVVIKDFVRADSPAWTKWSYDYFKEIAGDTQVSVYGREEVSQDRAASAPVAKMKFREYLDLIQREPTELRLFLFNLMKLHPELKKDVLYNDITAGKVIQWLPYMFFGGEGSSTRNHYDIDMSHVFITQYQGIKKIWLFPIEQSDIMYKLPYNFHSIANIKTADLQEYPAVQYLSGFEAQFKEQVNAFNKNLTSLNAIYGGMLTAMGGNKA